MSILQLINVSRRFGGLAAVDDVSFSVKQGTILGLLGPNGAGKTTIVNLVSGVLRPSQGEILFKGQRISHLPSYRICRLGLARTFQVMQPFPEMTALENVAAAALFAGGATSIEESRVAALKHLDRVGLQGRGDVLASALTLGQRKRLEFAKSLAMNPSMLLLDEVNAGLHGSELGEAIALIKSLAAEGMTIVIIEHLMKVVTSL